MVKNGKHFECSHLFKVTFCDLKNEFSYFVYGRGVQLPRFVGLRSPGSGYQAWAVYFIREKASNPETSIRSTQLTIKPSNLESRGNPSHREIPHRGRCTHNCRRARTFAGPSDPATSPGAALCFRPVDPGTGFHPGQRTGIHLVR